MTVPATNISMITDIRDDFMMGSGDVSLNATRYRDGCLKGTGDIAVMDYAKCAWGQGRVTRKTQNGDSTSGMRPWMWDQRADGGITHSDVTWTLGESAAKLPTWKSYHTARTGKATAAYFNGYFRTSTTGTFRLTGTLSDPDGLNRGVEGRLDVVAFQSGYLSGAASTLLSIPGQTKAGDISFDFTIPDTTKPHIVVSFSNWMDVKSSMSTQRGGWTFTNLQVKKL